MPIGIQRLNAPRPQPSSQIIFIKPLPGPTEKYAQDFLERIAAICHPIMRANHLSIMTLEEHEPNPEFIGRNFNAGEIIQLVLKAPYSGHWLSFRSVQMVMMHELAHCKQMNHSGAFWKVNNQFKGELRELWAKNYTGDGLWGRRQTLLSGEYHAGGHAGDEELPRNLCGGTFRSSRRGKRKRGGERPNETYAERQQRRIKKKFGVNGVALGDDEDTKVKLENGKKPKGKPRVAGSKRGRDLRAAAALARFDQAKDEDVKREVGELFGDSETESDSDDTGVKTEAFDLDGSQMKDATGRGMVRVCGDEDQDDVHVKQEMHELHELEDSGPGGFANEPKNGRNRTGANGQTPLDVHAETHSRLVSAAAGSGMLQPASKPSEARLRMEDIPLYVEPETEQLTKTKSPKSVRINITKANHTAKPPNHPIRSHLPTSPSDLNGSTQASEIICPICSMSNEPSSLLCLACSHVLDTNKITKHWRCQSDICKSRQYINAADQGLCGICGARRSNDEPGRVYSA
ncbi:DNA-dependent metalloprotease WSS1, partial [Lecanoromycetidae sp. Uapishka_2]